MNHQILEEACQNLKLGPFTSVYAERQAKRDNVRVIQDCIDKSICEIIRKVEYAHFRTIADTGSHPNAMTIWNTLRQAAGLPAISDKDLPVWEEEHKCYVRPKNSQLL